MTRRPRFDPSPLPGGLATTWLFCRRYAYDNGVQNGVVAGVSGPRNKGLGEAFAWGVTSASCEQLGRPVNWSMLFIDTRSRDGGFLGLCGDGGVSLLFLHHNDFSPWWEIRYHSRFVQRLSRLYSRVSRVRAHDGFCRRLNYPPWSVLLGAILH